MKTTTTKVVCDRCGKDISMVSHGRAKVVYSGECLKSYVVEHNSDLCSICVKKLEELWIEFMKNK